jgi:protein-tyrosine phosphatase
VIDLHSHLLPGVDDGSRSVEQSVQVLERLVSQGLNGLCLTPHLLASQAAFGAPEAHEIAFAALEAAAPAGISLYRGAEVMLDRPLDARVAEHRLVTLNATRYILVEFPRLVAAQTVEHALALVVAIGLVPLLAHPERYRCCHPDAVRRWKSLGALMQVDGPTLLSPRPRGVRARQLVEYGLADIAAADNHGDDRSLSVVWHELLAQDGLMQADLLLKQNPLAIIQDRLVEAVPPLEWRVSISDRLRALFGRGAGEDRP